MKRFLLLLTLCPTVVLAQLNESFSDGEILNNPSWFGQVDSFIVNSEKKLQLNASAAGESFIHTESEVTENASWSFDIDYDFSPSTSNYARIFLVMDNPDPINVTNAIFCDIGRNSDRIELGVIENGEEEIIIQSEDDLMGAASNSFQITINRTDNNWTLNYNKGQGEVSVGHAGKEIGFSSSWFGIYCKYTKTRKDKFFFDNIMVEGDAFQDRFPPEVIDYGVNNGEQLFIVFNEELQEDDLLNENFYLKKLDRNPSEVAYNTNENKVELYFYPALDDVQYETLEVSNIHDLNGNTLLELEFPFSYERVKVENVVVISMKEIEFHFSRSIPVDNWLQADLELDDHKVSFHMDLSDDHHFYHLILSDQLENGQNYQLQLKNLRDDRGDTIRTFNQEIYYYQPTKFDVVFNELLPDPTPQVGLPDCEYIELYNRSGFDLSLKDWKLQVNDKVTFLPDSTLKADHYALLVSSSDTDLWPDEVVAVTKFPALTNDGFNLILSDSESKVMDAFQYDPGKINGDLFKKEGGWSVERLDVNNMSGRPNNWKWSVDLIGGTPSIVNSVEQEYKDENQPWHVYTEVISDSVFRIHFSEMMNFIDDDWSLNIYPQIESFHWHHDSLFLQFVDLVIGEQLVTNREYLVKFNDLKDWAGNELMNDHPIRIASPDTLVSGDVLINEILFNPFPDGVDFVEVVNVSDKVLNLNDLFFGLWDDDKIIQRLYPFSIQQMLLFPQEYLALSEDSLTILDHYKCENKYAFLNTNMPSMPDKEGAVVICNQGGRIIDYIEYSNEMHFDLIRDTEGISLERLSSDMPTHDRQNWHSAASSAMATPGFVNSQVVSNTNIEKSIALDYDVFTPNGDGDKDQLIIRYNNNDSDVIANIRIFDSAGREVRYLINNSIMEREGYYIWDGMDEKGQCLLPGIYIVLCQRVSVKGTVMRDKLVCVIGFISNS